MVSTMMLVFLVPLILLDMSTAKKVVSDAELLSNPTLAGVIHNKACSIWLQSGNLLDAFKYLAETLGQNVEDIRDMYNDAEFQSDSFNKHSSSSEITSYLATLELGNEEGPTTDSFNRVMDNIANTVDTTSILFQAEIAKASAQLWREEGSDKIAMAIPWAIIKADVSGFKFGYESTGNIGVGLSQAACYSMEAAGI